MSNVETSKLTGQPRLTLQRNRPLRPSGTVWVKAYSKKVGSKGGVLVKGHWRHSKPEKPRNPLYALLQSMRDLGQNQEDHEVLLGQFAEASAAFAEWKPGSRSRRKGTVTRKADLNTEPSVAQVSKQLQVEILKQTVRGVDDSLLAAAGLQRIPPSGQGTVAGVRMRMSSA